MFEDKYKAVNDSIMASDELKERIRQGARNEASHTVTVNGSELKEITPSASGGKGKFIALFAGCAACMAIVAAVAIGFSMKNNGENLVTPPANTGTGTTASIPPVTSPIETSPIEDVTDVPATQSPDVTDEDNRLWTDEPSPELNHTTDYMGDSYNFSELIGVAYGASNMYPVQGEKRSLDEIKEFNIGRLQYENGVSADWSYMGDYVSISESGEGYKRYSYSLLDFFVNIEYGDWDAYGDYGAYHFYDEPSLEVYANDSNIYKSYKGQTAPTSTINGYEVKLGISPEGCFMMSFADKNKPLRVRISMMGSGEEVEQKFLFIVRSFCYDVLDGYTMAEEKPEIPDTASFEDFNVTFGKVDELYVEQTEYPDESTDGTEMLNNISGRDFTAFVEAIDGNKAKTLYTGTTNEADGADRAYWMVVEGMSMFGVSVYKNAPDNDTMFADGEPASEYKGYSFTIGESGNGQYALVLEYKHENGTLYRLQGFTMTRESFLEYCKLFFDTVFINVSDNTAVETAAAENS